jgi:hypothetical protein
MLMAARLVDRTRLIARRHLGRRGIRRVLRLYWTHVRRHRQLLEQKAKQRDQRNPTTMTVATKKHKPNEISEYV